LVRASAEKTAKKKSSARAGDKRQERIGKKKSPGKSKSPATARDKQNQSVNLTVKPNQANT